MVDVKTVASRVKLTDEQMRQFIVYGFLKFKADVPAQVNETILRRVDEEFSAHAQNGNNILPAVPELGEVFKDRHLAGALSSVVGDQAIMHPHRAVHFNPAGTDRIGWHKDSYWGYTQRVRNHRNWWAMIMYYPQDTWEDTGPTGVLPGRQNHHTRGENDSEGMATVTGAAGTFFMIHYDLWHTATSNTSKRNRYMLKFEYIRMAEPTAPDWQCEDRTWREPEGELPVYPHRNMWRQIWDWSVGNKPSAYAGNGNQGALGGEIARLTDADPKTRSAAADEIGLMGAAATDAIDPLIAALDDETAPTRLNSAYALAGMGDAAVDKLQNALIHASEHGRCAASYALGAMGEVAQAALVSLAGHDDAGVRAECVYGLGEICDVGTQAINVLVGALDDSSPVVRLRAADALGMRGKASKSAVGALCDHLDDDENEVRFNAALALARIGSEADDAVPALVKGLSNSNRYVIGYAVEALQRIGTPQAMAALISHLKAARWCPLTKWDSPFFP